MWPSSGNTQVGRNMYRIVNSENNKKVCDGRITSIRLTYYHNVNVSSKVSLYDLISQKTLFFCSREESADSQGSNGCVFTVFCLITRKTLKVTEKMHCTQNVHFIFYFTTSVANIFPLYMYLRSCTESYVPYSCTTAYTSSRTVFITCSDWDQNCTDSTNFTLNFMKNPLSRCLVVPSVPTDGRLVGRTEGAIFNGDYTGMRKRLNV
jgi:hypothetical protein